MDQSKRCEAHRPVSLDLFCGIGGLALGAERGGVHCIGGIDYWEDAASTFEHNLNKRCMTSDLRSTSLEEIESFFDITAEKIDLIMGGPPCQGFSTVGKRDAADPRNALWLHFCEIVDAIRPAYVLIENVEGLAVMESGRVCERISESFGQIGYHMKWKLVRSSDYGVPQLRKRVVFMGWLESLAEPQFPTPLSTPPVSVAEAIFDLPSLASGETKDRYENAPHTPFQRARRKHQRVLHNHTAANHPPRMVEILKHIPDGGNRLSIPDHLQPSSGFHNSYARLSSTKPAVAVTSNMRKPSSARATHPKQHRGLTVREGLRLQTFDDGFVELGSRTSQYLQVGNAVPPLLAQALAESVVEAFNANTSAAISRTRSRRPGSVKNVRGNDGQILLKLKS